MLQKIRQNGKQAFFTAPKIRKLITDSKFRIKLNSPEIAV